MSNLFPKSANHLPLQIGLFLLVFVGLATAGVTYYMTPKYTRVGYTPVQPVPFSHQLHIGQLGLDCRYCHSNVEKSGHANVPTSQTCMNCHNQIKTQSPLLAVVRKSFETGEPVPWVKVHRVPDFAYFNHSAHINRGVSCVECHGRIDQMEVVQQTKSLSMEFCIDCHRAPELAVRSRELVTNLGWQHPEGAAGQLRDGQKFVQDWKIKPPQSCSGCHR
jgi:Cytochrome c7 and related cytochrome c